MTSDTFSLYLSTVHVVEAGLPNTLVQPEEPEQANQDMPADDDSLGATSGVGSTPANPDSQPDHGVDPGVGGGAAGGDNTPNNGGLDDDTPPSKRQKKSSNGEATKSAPTPRTYGKDARVLEKIAEQFSQLREDRGLAAKEALAATSTNLDKQLLHEAAMMDKQL